MAKKTRQYTANQLSAMIRSKYSGSAYAVLEQVANGTGNRCGSWVDAVVFSLWPSNGIWRAACEIKVSRADFLKEMSQPNKNQWAREHFDFFWYIVAPGVAKEDEIPTGTGMMVVRGEGLSVVKQAPRREDAKTDSSLVASFARSLDKERERFVKERLREAIEQDSDYRKAMLFKSGCERYLRECNVYCHPESGDEVYEKLQESMRNQSPLAAEADHVLQCLSSFHDRVVSFCLGIAPLAADVLNARDEAGEFVVKAWGGKDEKAIATMREIIKNRGKRDYRRDDMKHQVAMREVLSELQSTPPNGDPQ